MSKNGGSSQGVNFQILQRHQPSECLCKIWKFESDKYDETTIMSCEACFSHNKKVCWSLGDWPNCRNSPPLFREKCMRVWADCLCDVIMSSQLCSTSISLLWPNEIDQSGLCNLHDFLINCTHRLLNAEWVIVKHSYCDRDSLYDITTVVQARRNLILNWFWLCILVNSNNSVIVIWSHAMRVLRNLWTSLILVLGLIWSEMFMLV